MKRVLLIVLTGWLCWLGMPAFSQNKYSLPVFYRCTREEEIIRAFRLMSSVEADEALDRVVQKPMRVIFKDMRELGKEFKDYDALNWISAQGQQVIFINEKHRTAPPEALAALISHEAMHADEFNSIQEEIAGWQEEARVWQAMTTRQPELAEVNHPLVTRLNRISAEYRQGTLAVFVRQRPGYSGLPENSPGFEVVAFPKVSQN